MQGHLMPHAAKGKGGDRATRPRVDFHWWQRVLDMGRTSFGIRVAMSATTAPRASGLKKEKENYGGNYSTVKSAQRLSATLSIRPRGRINIIDVSLGSILVCKDIRLGPPNLQLCAKVLNVCVSGRLSTASTITCEHKACWHAFDPARLLYRPR
jgi:hypothetical protein